MSKLPPRGFTLAEALIAVAVIAVIAAIGVASISRYHTTVGNTKLESDVATLNRAVVAYQANGGSLDSLTEVGEVLAKLRAGAQSEQLVGLKGSFVDARVTAVMLTPSEASDTSNRRACWNATKKRFELRTDGSGAKEFVLGGTMAAPEEVRDMTLKFAGETNWVWDYEDRALPGRATFDDVPITPATPDSPTGPVGWGTPLAAPNFSVASGSYPLINYDMNLVLTDPNPPGVSQIIASIDGGPFQIHSSGAISVQPDTTVAAYSLTIDPDRWGDSPTVSHTYSTTPVQLDVDFTVPELLIDYVDVGGAMIPGSGPAPTALAPGAVVLDNAALIPMRYQNDSVFSIQWTYDGVDPKTAATKLVSAPFSGGFPGQSIDYGLSRWAGATTTLPVQVVARSYNTSLVTDSPVVPRILSLTPIPLRAPQITIGSTSVTIAPVTTFGDTPVGARVFYSLDGTPPGDLNGVPTSGSLYAGPIPVAVAKGKAINARVFAPTGVEKWFVASPVANDSITVKYGEIKMALLIDESGSIDSTEAADIRAGLSSFFVDELNSGNEISVVGMSASDYDVRADHISATTITGVTKPAFDNWATDFRSGRVSIQADYWGSALDVAASQTDLNLALIIGDGIQGDIVNIANHVSKMRANGTHVFFIGIDPGEYIYSGSTISPSPSTAIDSVFGSESEVSTQPDLSDMLSTDYVTESTFSNLGATLAGMTATLKAAFGE